MGTKTDAKLIKESREKMNTLHTLLYDACFTILGGTDLLIHFLSAIHDGRITERDINELIQKKRN